MSRIVLTNKNVFKSFITLTFSDNIIDISIANKEFHKFITKIKRTFPEFSYVVVPEFQKNGKVHYHLLTNIDYHDSLLINENIETTKLYHNKTESQINYINEKYNELNLLKNYSYKELNSFPVVFRFVDDHLENCKCTYNKKTNSYKYFKTLKYWNNGFSNVVSIENINIIGYMSKYMTKNIDNRLFGKQRYFYSLNLKKPETSYFNLSNDLDFKKFDSIFNFSNINYTNNYLDKFGNSITFFELKDS